MFGHKNLVVGMTACQKFAVMLLSLTHCELHCALSVLRLVGAEVWVIDGILTVIVFCRSRVEKW